MTKYNLENNPPEGLDQMPEQPPGPVKTDLTINHDVDTGWPVKKFRLPAHIYLQDDLTYKAGKILELEKYMDYYGDNINQVTFYVWHNHLDRIYPNLNFVYYPKFHYNHLNELTDKKTWDNFKFNTQKEFVFLCLNMNRRPHRDKTVQLLQNMPSRLISYKAVGWNIFGHDSDITHMDYNEKDSIHEANIINLTQLQPVYNRCQFSVVTETRYSLPYDFITEKTTQCFIALHPALYVSNRGHVQELRNYGFDVFDDVFDHSYDTVEDDLRIEHMVESNRSVLEKGIPNYGNLKDRLLENRRHYLDPKCPLYEVK